ncbi:30S ribosomal protein S15 [Mesohalobacter halotolerans]|jgi:small subunit ribosomal protein S15|uniref:Small ribosomal subunit protein uS15 n=1 Tax=Mesohalobacter halotolerans TaxID=1883405 RepID=A0A4U5TQP9_9FLAO|nr:30S ribosomal protein S15 [Mesohalobacter halotolerans]MBS3737766.1 30S ribosomal protein S15 [Psychroflexus sp.]NBC56781.1 30S ribosomal protein S15 [Bacteroidota bacterium]TKS56537.1 30S ribosomal protein S15 [Mesohalobacter halotolerans]
MYITSEDKKKLFAKHGKNEKDTGSTEGQIALMTKRIQHMSDHLKKNTKDFNSERALVRTVGKRRDLLNYLMKKDIERYRAIVKDLGLRK